MQKLKGTIRLDGELIMSDVPFEIYGTQPAKGPLIQWYGLMEIAKVAPQLELFPSDAVYDLELENGQRTQFCPYLVHEQCEESVIFMIKGAAVLS